MFVEAPLREQLDIRLRRHRGGIRLIRRNRRDLEHAAARSPPARQYDATLSPEAQRFVEPSKRLSDLMSPRRDTTSRRLILFRRRSLFHWLSVTAHSRPADRSPVIASTAAPRPGAACLTRTHWGVLTGRQLDELQDTGPPFAIWMARTLRTVARTATLRR